MWTLHSTVMKLCVLGSQRIFSLPIVQDRKQIISYWSSLMGDFFLAPSAQLFGSPGFSTNPSPSSKLQGQGHIFFPRRIVNPWCQSQSLSVQTDGFESLTHPSQDVSSRFHSCFLAPSSSLYQASLRWLSCCRALFTLVLGTEPSLWGMIHVPCANLTRVAHVKAYLLFIFKACVKHFATPPSFILPNTLKHTPDFVKCHFMVKFLSKIRNRRSAMN